jgi:hypothetical protein
VVDTLLNGIDNRFHFLFQQLGIKTDCTHDGKCLAFDSPIFLMASAVDPKYSFHWLVDHPGTDEEKDVLRRKIIGN